MEIIPGLKYSAPSFYVGIGASAGGLEALEAFFTHMPAKSQMAFIVIQHLSPDYKSLMVELLSKRTEMPVRRAEDGMLVEPGTVYLIPPKKILTIFHGQLILRDQDPQRGINLPIDIFLRSLADDQAEKAIGIILSGTGSDGVRGIQAIKEAGGMVMVQKEETARFDGMPRSAIATGLVDIILSPEEMPSRLMSFSQHLGVVIANHPQALLSDEDGLARIFALLRERTRVDFTYYKPSTVLRRIERRMTIHQIEDLREYVRLIENQSGEAVQLYRELLIGVTSFFRDHEVFEELERIHIPQIISDAKSREVRVWVAGCSTGEEAYSLAILFREVMERTSRRLDVKIFATDIDRDAITHASVGMYPESIVGDLPPRILAKYFHPREDRYQIDRSIREMVVFAQHNLTKDPPFTNIDLVSCRNLLIYLQPILQRKVLEMINFSLIPKGILMLGTSETTGEMGDFYDLIHHKFKLYRSKGKHNLVADHSDFNMTLEGRMDKSRQRYGSRVRNPPQDDVKILDRLLQSLASDYLPLAVVVNEQFEVLQIFGNTEGYFLIPAGKMMNDVTKLAIKELSIPLATGLQKVFRSEDGELRYTNIRVRQGAKSRTLQMRIKRLPGKKTQEPLAVVLLDENHSPLTDLSSSEGLVVDINAEAEQRIRDLEQELQFTKENLQATIEELETTNEELQATNEELLASNEELQSTNEELQSVNEELHTVNAEYQSKIIELTELNNDLDNLLASTRIGTLFLDENLEIRKFTPEMTHIFNIMGSDLGRPIHHLVHRLANIDPIQVVREVEAKRTSQSMEVLTQDGDWYLMRVLPYQVGVNAISGVVLTFIEISQMKQVETALVDKTEHLTSLFRAIPIGAGLHVDQFFTDVNDQICEMLGYTRQELLGHSIELVYGNEQDFVDVENEVKIQLSQSNFAAVETNWKRKDGSLFPVLYTLAPMHPSDVADSYTFSVQDLSALHNAIELAQSREKQYHRLFTTMMEGVVYHNSQGEIISANPAAERVLGLTLDQLMGRTSVDPRWRAIREDGSEFPGNEHPAMVALRTGKPVQGVVMGVINPVDDSTHWIYVNAVPLFLSGSERPDQVYATFDDITDSVQFSRRLLQTQQRLDIALSIADVAWWDLNLQTRRVDASDMKYRWLGFDPAEVEHTLDFWLSRIHPDDLEQALQCMRDYLAGSTPRYEAQYRLQTKQGEWLRFIDRGEAVERDESGKVVRLVGTVHHSA